MLEKRYKTWKSIIESEVVEYNKELNTIKASKETWNNIYMKYELGGLYNDGENEHMWAELEGIFGPDSIWVQRNAMITPFPIHKYMWNRDDITKSGEEDDSPEKWIDFVEDTDNEETEAEKALTRAPKGHICPYPGDKFMNSQAANRGESSQGSGKQKKLKFKRFLHF